MTKLTNPRTVSAPLPDDVRLPWNTGDLVAEVNRAAVELRWALHRQRAAWAKMAQIKSELDERNIAYVDNERAWKLATGDVSWWRGEVSSRANALSALLVFAAACDVPVGLLSPLALSSPRVP